MTFRRLLRRFFDAVSRISGGIGRRIYQTPLEKQVASWYSTPDHGNLRFDYDLNPASQVFDLGGYEGQWASDIHARYGCTVHVFEPVEEYADNIQRRFARNGKIAVHPFGLGAADMTLPIGLGEDRSSAFQAAAQTRAGRIVKTEDFLAAQGIARIDLMKINIEGGEYELLEYLLDTGLVAQIENIQVQFHDFIPNAGARMHSIQERLRQSHTLTYQVEFVWENWILKAEQSQKGTNS